MTSGAIAAMVGVHPVHVRRVMGALREAGLVESQSGPTGGWELARDPKEITLYDIYLALEPELPFEMPARTPDACCRFAPYLPQALAGAMDSAKRALQQPSQQCHARPALVATRAVWLCQTTPKRSGRDGFLDSAAPSYEIPRVSS